MTSYPVHPVAALFPLMRDDELADLAADIKTNGLVHPIVLADVDGVETLIDGRNRLAACERASVEPAYQTINGRDAVAYILSVNVARRQMTKGAIAMVCAKAYPESEGRGGHKKKSSPAEHFPMVSSGKLSEARTILQFAPELADLVIAGTKSLNEAYAEACERKGAASSDEAKMERLRADAPDLAELVAEERIKLSDGMAALKERADEQERRRRVATENLYRVFDILFPREATPNEWAQTLIANASADMWPETAAAPISKNSLRQCVDVLSTIAKTWRD